MAVWTVEELAPHVLAELGLLPAGRAAAARDSQVILDRWESVYAHLAMMGWAVWPHDEIPIEAHEPLMLYVAGRVAKTFGYSGQELAEFRAGGKEGEITLQRVSAALRTTQPTRVPWY